MIFLTGAPAASLLDWSEENLNVPLLRAFQERQDKDNALEATLMIRSHQPVWRCLPSATIRQPSELSQKSVYLDHDPLESTLANEEASFLTSTEISCLPDDSNLEGSLTSLHSGLSSEDTLSQFYENSFLVHEDLPTFNVTALHPNDDRAMELSSGSISDDRAPLGSITMRPEPKSRCLTILSEIPNAAYLRSLEPQTVTVDLVVGILHVSQPRLIKTRRDNRSVELVELTVADHTKAGFGISIWLSQGKVSGSNKAQTQDLRSRMTTIRPRDIVLAKNLALTSFQNRVHGQSLRRANTTLDLLYRVVVDPDDEVGAYTLRELDKEASDLQLSRVKQVKEWIMSFVGSGPDLLLQPRKNSKDPRGKARLLQDLPSDTP